MTSTTKGEGPPVIPHDDNAVARSAVDKQFSTLAARAALCGWQLWRSDAADDRARYFATRWGLVRMLADQAAIEQFLKQAGA